MVQCKAKSKRSGVQCKNNAVKKKTVCRMHGACAGPKTVEGINSIKKSNTKHGMYTKELIEERKKYRQLYKDFYAILK